MVCAVKKPWTARFWVSNNPVSTNNMIKFAWKYISLILEPFGRSLCPWNKISLDFLYLLSLSSTYKVKYGSISIVIMTLPIEITKPWKSFMFVLSDFVKRRKVQIGRLIRGWEVPLWRRIITFVPLSVPFTKPRDELDLMLT